VFIPHFNALLVGMAYPNPKKIAPHQKKPKYKIGVWMIFTKKVVQLGSILC
jgi:hypothetical protein